MNLTRLLEKDEQIQTNILNYLLQNGGKATYEELSKAVKVGKTTLLKHLELLKDYFPEADCLVEEENCAFLKEKTGFSYQEVLSDFVKSSLNYQILVYLFANNKEAGMVRMSLDLNLSETTLFRKLKSLKEPLTEFGLGYKNGEVVGEELQIRYFYFQLFWTVVSTDELYEGLRKKNSFKVVKALERQLKEPFTKENEVKLALWIEISTVRFSGNRPPSSLHLSIKKEKSKLYPILEETLFRFYSRFALDWQDQEAEFLYVFMISMEVFDKYSYNYHLIEADLGTLTRLETYYKHFKKDYIATYQYNIFENEEYAYYRYLLLNASAEALIFKGKIIYFDLQRINHFESEDIYEKGFLFIQQFIKNHQQFFRRLEENDFQILIWKYMIVLVILNKKQTDPFTIGIRISKSPFWEEYLMNLMEGLFSNLYQFRVSPVKPNETYTFVLSDSKEKENFNCDYFYHIHSFDSYFDEKNVLKILREVYKQRMQHQ